MSVLSRLFSLTTRQLIARQSKYSNRKRTVLVEAAFVRQLVQTMASSSGANGGEGSPGTNAKSKHTNRLAKEKSPYLLQHKYNPVDWYPWGEEAFEKAKKENKPIFLSVGYSTCHWCHVMERESFEDEKIGQILNEKYVPVKVDREERPDVDRVYMSYIQATTGGGGWPMSVWLTPDLKPFIGATYFPPEDKAGRPGFATILNLISNQWDTNKEKFTMQATIIMNAISAHVSEIKSMDVKLPGAECIDKLFSDMANSFDGEMGGFGGAPKFPQPVNLNFLLRYHVYKKQTEDGTKSLAMCTKTLECMEKGGMHDHVGQGFHRYSTDRFWHVPHFEKMLYDQAQMAIVYLDAYQLKKDEKFAETARDILLYVMRDLSHKMGGFYSAEDADSLPTETDTHKKEGAFCVWEEGELRALLTDSITNTAGESVALADVFIKHYGVESAGNVKPHQDPHKELANKNVLIVRGSLEETASHFKLGTAETNEHLGKAREILLEERSKRPLPHLDDKMVTAWNGLMISAFSRAAQTLGEDVYLKRAVKAAEFVKNYLFDEKTAKLYRSCYRSEGDKVSQFEKPIYGFVSDYVYLIRGLLDLYEASLDEQWLAWAAQLQDKLDQLFWDSNGGGYFEVTNEDPSILLRLKEEQDGAEPSANSASAGNLLRLSSFVDRKEMKEKAEQILTVFETRLTKIPIALPEMMGAYIVQQLGVKQIIIAGDREAEDTKALLRCLHSHFIPNKTLMLCDGKQDGFLHSKLAVFKTLERKDGKATAYVCKNYSCARPVNTVEDLKQVLSEN